MSVLLRVSLFHHHDSSLLSRSSKLSPLSCFQDIQGRLMLNHIHLYLCRDAVQALLFPLLLHRGNHYMLPRLLPGEGCVILLKELHHDIAYSPLHRFPMQALLQEYLSRHHDMMLLNMFHIHSRELRLLCMYWLHLLMR